MGTTWETIAPTPPLQATSTATLWAQPVWHSEPLRRLMASAVAADEPILLVVNDPHRATQTRPVLTELARFIRSNGLSGARAADQRRPLRFRVLIAAGTHCFPTVEREAFEQATFDACDLNIQSIAWHDAIDAQSLAPLAGVRMHRLVAQSRFLLPIGSVEPHYFAGLTGPHKTMTVGCMSREDIERNHEGALSPASDILRLVGNPVHDGIVAVLRALEAGGKMIHAIAEVVRGGSIVATAGGDSLRLLDELSPTVHQLYVRLGSEPADLLHLRVPPPLGRNLYQADKALKNNHWAVRDGGGIVLDADCHEGIGPDAFMDLLRGSADYRSARQIVLDRGYRLGDHKAVKLRHLMDPSCRGVHVAVVSPHLNDSDLCDTGMALFRDARAACDWLAGVVTGSLARGLIVKDAGMMTVTSRTDDPPGPGLARTADE